MLGHLKNIFSIILILILSAINIPNILNYIQISLKLFLLFQIYKLFLNRPNLKYIVYLIQKSGFQDLAFFIPRHGSISEIPKIIVFINKIENIIKL